MSQVTTPVRTAASPERRRFLLVASAVVASTLTAGRSIAALAQTGSAGPFSLPKLPYAYDALAPVIDQPTMTIHHTSITKTAEPITSPRFGNWSTGIRLPATSRS